MVVKLMNLNNLNTRKKVVLIIVLITILQIGLRFYIGAQGLSFNVDEVHSYSLMNNEQLSIIENNNFSQWILFILNMFIFSISSIFVYKISKILFRNPLYCILMCFINGFSQISINSSMYIGTSELCNMFILGITYFYMRIWRTKHLTWKRLLPITILNVLGGLTNFSFFIYAFVLYCLYTIKCIKNKNYDNCFKYQIAIALSIITYLCTLPHFINYILALENPIIFFNFSNTLDKSIEYFKIINKEFFNTILIIVFVAITLICCKKRKTKIIINSQIYMFIFPIILYLLFAIMTSQYAELIHIIPIYSVVLILVFYLIKHFFLERIKSKETLFILIFMSLLVLYSPLMFK